MPVQDKHQHLAQVKLALARKYENLARVVKSKPRSRTWFRLAARFRRQAEEVLRPLAKLG